MRCFLAVLWVMGTWIGQTLAQEYPASDPKPLAPDSIAIEWVITFVFLVACLVVAFKPTKRAKLE